MFLLYLEVETDWTHYTDYSIALFENEDKVKEKQKELKDWCKKYVGKKDEDGNKMSSLQVALKGLNCDILNHMDGLECCESYDFIYEEIHVYKKEIE